MQSFVFIDLNRRTDKMKRILMICLAVYMVVGISACGNTTSSNDSESGSQGGYVPYDEYTPSVDTEYNVDDQFDTEDKNVASGPLSTLGINQLEAGKLNLSSPGEIWVEYSMYDSFLKNDGYTCDVLVPGVEAYNYNHDNGRNDPDYLISDKYSWGYSDFNAETQFEKDPDDDHDYFIFNFKTDSGLDGFINYPTGLVALYLKDDFVYADDSEYLNELMENLIDSVVGSPNRNKYGNTAVKLNASGNNMGVYATSYSSDLGDVCSMVEIETLLDDRQILSISVITNACVDVTNGAKIETGIEYTNQMIVDILTPYGLGDFAQSVINGADWNQGN